MALETATPTHLLILGGTAEAAALARRLDGVPGLQVTSSLAGRTTGGRDLPGSLRVGGFGGVDGLAAYLATAEIDLLVDATHPFAAEITRNAAAACAAAGVARLRLQRPAWQPMTGDRWEYVDAPATAAPALGRHGANVFLATGRSDLAAFSHLGDKHFLVRLVESPQAPLELAHATLVTGRGPFREAEDRALLQKHAIDVVVTKNSGGDGAYAKLAAARALGLPVVMIDRPPEPEGETVASVNDARDWVLARIGR
ncbi:cobalt-precorrin-6A reductase [Rhodovibrio salinarum]|uniref:Cobalt-precorrin-6A reductase n=1 Tax=Rhodovibrio salinarum TaxID=1087 RepID=A0A934QIN5_9PROT|nr:cobalt-precorrin-6A reductase [Rhodovibrio salinarum]MBK1697594.1 cobalt-precorrin-6A reductase [Rhodovibrio salinarum]